MADSSHVTTRDRGDTRELEDTQTSAHDADLMDAAFAAFFFVRDPLRQIWSRCDNPRMELLIVSLASLLAGLVDSIVGGGGLILIPALFATFPNAAPVTLLGTNKSASVWGTAFASFQYSRQVQMQWHALLPAAAAGVIGSLCGAGAVQLIDPSIFRKALPFLLVLLLGYTLAKKDLGRHHTPRFSGRHAAWAAGAIGLVIGFYDGFFGPGTGSFLVFAFVRIMGYDFLNASASAKLINTATNFSALVLFAMQGQVWWHLALAMALANIVGSLIGTRLALKHGAGFVRIAFIGVVGALILKTSYDTWFRF